MKQNNEKLHPDFPRDDPINIWLRSQTPNAKDTFKLKRDYDALYKELSLYASLGRLHNPDLTKKVEELQSIAKQLSAWHNKRLDMLLERSRKSARGRKIEGTSKPEVGPTFLGMHVPPGVSIQANLKEARDFLSQLSRRTTTSDANYLPGGGLFSGAGHVKEKLDWFYEKVKPRGHGISSA